jgi:hypothetical protein
VTHAATSRAAEEYVDWEPPRLQRAQPVPWRAAATAFFLFVVGVAFGFAGLGLFLTKGLHEAGPFLIIGAIGGRSADAIGVCRPRLRTGFIPGAYHVVILYLAWRGVPGYTYSMIPQFQD